MSSSYITLLQGPSKTRNYRQDIAKNKYIQILVLALFWVFLLVVLLPFRCTPFPLYFILSLLLCLEVYHLSGIFLLACSDGLQGFRLLQVNSYVSRHVLRNSHDGILVWRGRARSRRLHYFALIVTEFALVTCMFVFNISKLVQANRKFALKRIAYKSTPLSKVATAEGCAPPVLNLL